MASPPSTASGLVLMYRQYYTQQEWDDIVNDESDPVHRFPHCNTSTFHEPGICPFCDHYYKMWPMMKPIKYAKPEANGWGGNSAPILDNEMAKQEKAEWERAMRQMTKREWEQEQETWLEEKVREIKEVFVRKK